jgi:hypothetical protein
MTANPKDSTAEEKKGPVATIKEKFEDNEDRFAILSTFVRLGILVWSGSILTLAYIKLPAYLKIPEQKLDPTFIASVFTGVLATFGVQTTKKGAAAAGGITKVQLQELIDKAAQTAPAQTIRIEQAPVVIKPDAKTD